MMSKANTDFFYNIILGIFITCLILFILTK
jgi:hypothetical protein